MGVEARQAISIPQVAARWSNVFGRQSKRQNWTSPEAGSDKSLKEHMPRCSSGFAPSQEHLSRVWYQDFSARFFTRIRNTYIMR